MTEPICYFNCGSCLDAYPYEQGKVAYEMEVVEATMDGTHDARAIPRLLCPKCYSLLWAGEPAITKCDINWGCV